MVKIPKLEDFPGLTKEDIEKVYMVRFHLIDKRRDCTGILATYPPGPDDDPGELCPLCDKGSYYHIDMFFSEHRHKYPIVAAAKTICLSCMHMIDDKLAEKSPEEIKAIEKYCRRRFGDKIFDVYIFDDHIGEE